MMRTDLYMKNSKKAGLYIHVPFCSKKCNYCDFYSFKSDDLTKEMYVTALISQIKEKASVYADRVFDSVYIGGGTPTALGTRLLCQIVSAVNDYFRIEECAEFTVETNPGIEASFADLRLLGANRLSIGLQSANTDELELLGRIHSLDDYKRTFELARSAGFDNISTDIMFSLPFQTIEKLGHTLDFIADFEPEHISAYSLKIEEGTPFYRMRSEFKLPDEDTDADMYLYICERLAKLGYEHYEISNFAKPERASRHNLRYWKCEEYLGLGSAAHSYMNGTRYAYTRDANAFFRVYESGDLCEKDIISEHSVIDRDESVSEALMLGLRLSEGITDALLEKLAPLDTIYKKINPLIKSGLIIKTRDGIALTANGMYVSNAVIGYISDIAD